MRPRYLTPESLNAIKLRINKEMSRRNAYGPLDSYAEDGHFEYIRLPEGYTQLEYIEGTGTQYIDTGFKPNNNTRLVLDIELPAQDSYPKALLGGRDGDASSSKSFVIFIMNATRFRTDFGSTTANMDMSIVGRFLIDKNKNVTTINGTKATITNSTFQSSYNLCLLTETDVGGADTRITAGKIRLCQMYENDVFIRNYVPCLNPDNVAGLYDLTYNTFYGDAAGGEFIAGPVFTGINFGEMVIKDHRKKTFDLLIHVNDFMSNNALTDNEDDILVADIDKAENFISQLEAETMEGSSSSCRGACSGLCLGTCSNSCSGCTDTCSGGCGNACTSCGSGCSRTCSGCTGGCSGCSGCAGCGGCGSCSSGCSSGCSGCTGSCSYECATSCSGSCAGDCSGCSGGCIGSCTGACAACTGCSQSCSSGCLGCGGSCGGSCGSSATASCASCSGYCTSCSGTCQGCSGCSGGCGDSCSGCGGCVNCSGGCYGGCSGCSSGCTSTCGGSCTGVCNGCNADCVGGCTGGCSGCSSGCTGCSSCSGCSGACSGGCSATCSNACSATCINSCSSCSGGCGGCSGSCGTECSGSCSSNCSSTCYSNCTGTCYGQVTSSVTS